MVYKKKNRLLTGVGTAVRYYFVIRAKNGRVGEFLRLQVKWMPAIRIDQKA
jgi:hypothetical protein